MTSASTALPEGSGSPESTPVPAPRLRHPLTLPHFRNLWIGVTISLLGDQFYLLALPWLVLQLTGSSLMLGTILMTAAIPRAALMLVGGAVTDRFSARRVLTTTAAVRAVLVGVVALLIWRDLIQVWQLYALTFAFGVADAFSFPAGSTLIPTLVQPEQLQPANALFQSSTVLTQLAGPLPAGLLMKSMGVASALFFDALSFLAVIVALFRIPDPPKAPLPAGAGGAPARPSMLHSIAEGLRSVRNDPPLMSLMAIFAAINFCVAGPIGVGLASLAKFRFGSEVAFGTLLSSFSAGTLAGIVAGGMVKRPRKRGLQFIIMSLLCGLELIGIGLVPKAYGLAAIAALLALMGLGVGFVNVQFSSWMQMRVERALLGRVMSVLMFAAVGLVPISLALSGVLASWSLGGLFIAAGAVLVVSSGLALSGKAAREID
ncbi:MAG TPA: MFS transporter [Thermoanaerobaculia bacterium]|jgi:MFS family permease|nr:MFS transporter [Thermoanaerobaculia bacterium]